MSKEKIEKDKEEQDPKPSAEAQTDEVKDEQDAKPSVEEQTEEPEKEQDPKPSAGDQADEEKENKVLNPLQEEKMDDSERKWECKRCKKELKSADNPVAYKNEVFCPGCIDRAEKEALSVATTARKKHARPLGVIYFTLWNICLALGFIFTITIIGMSNSDNDLMFSNWGEGLKVGLGFLCGLIAIWDLVLATGLIFQTKWGIKLRLITTIFEMVSVVIGLIVGIVLVIMYVAGIGAKLMSILGLFAAAFVIFFVLVLIFEYFDREKVKKTFR